MLFIMSILMITADGGDDGTGSDSWSKIVAEARYLHTNNEFPSMVFAILSGLPFESSTSIEDYRRDDIPTFASVSSFNTYFVMHITAYFEKHLVL